MGPGFEAAQRYLDEGAQCEALTPTLTPTLTSATSTRVPAMMRIMLYRKRSHSAVIVTTPPAPSTAPCRHSRSEMAG